MLKTMAQYDIPGSIREALSVRLFDLGGSPVTVSTVFTFLIIVLLGMLLARLLGKGTERFLRKRLDKDEGTVRATGRLTYYAVVALSAAVGLHTSGVNLGAFFAAGAVFAVAIGFAMQTIIQNFVAGLILLGERTIKPGDIIEVEGMFVQVRDMGIRVTVARTVDDEDLIIPNSLLAGATVKNFTFRDTLYRLRVKVGVAYSSDLSQVRKVLETTLGALEWRAQQKAPVILLNDFGSSSVDYDVSVWIEDPWHARRSRSDLREAIWLAFEENNITIAFPQVDVHFDDQALGLLKPTH